MSIAFPASPTEGDIYTVSEGRQFRFSNGRWSIHRNNVPLSEGMSTALNPIESTTPPALPSLHKFWWNPTTGKLSYQHNNAGALSWVEC